MLLNLCHICAHALARSHELEPRPAAMLKRKKTVAFTAKRRKDLVVDLGKRDYRYIDTVDSAIAMTQCGVHLTTFSEETR